jgi:hypothetical protein
MYGLSEGQYYFNIQSGIIMLSDSCSIFDYVRIGGSGLASKSVVNDAKLVPPMVAQALVLWVVERTARSLKSEDAKYRPIQTDAANQLDEFGLTGAWHQAKMRLAELDYKKMHDLDLYNQKLNY